MAILKASRMTPAILLRLAADTLLIQISLALALWVRLFLVATFQNADGTVDLRDISERYIGIYVNNAWLLTAVCLLIFYLNGFYTYGRYYQGKYKALVVSQAVTLAFLVYGFVGFFFGDLIGFPIPRVALVIAYGFTLAILVGARLWNQLWEHVVRAESGSIQLRKEGGLGSVLIIGGAGYIGSALVPELLEAGHRVRVLDVMMFGETPLDAVRNHPNLQIVRGDFRHVENVVHAIRGVDSVVHLGAIVGDPACSLDENLTIDINLSATRMVAELSKAMGVRRFIFASTCSVYGACDEILNERSEVKPVSLYGHTKLASERVLQEMADGNFMPTILRFATIYGLSGRIRFDLVVNLLAAKAKVDGLITIFNGDQWRPFVHVEDAARAIALVLQAPRGLVGREVFNVGSNEQNYTIGQIGDMIHQKVIGAQQVCESNADTRNYRVDFTKIQRLLAFEPEWTVERGIEQVLQAIASGQVLDYRDPQHSNFEHLNRQGTSRLARDNWAVELIRHMEV